MKKSDFEVFQEMASRDLDIRLSGNLVSAQTAKGGGHVVMGIDLETLRDITQNPGEHYVVLYVVNKKQFDEIKGDQ